MNRKGHIGTILMVFGALLLVGVALYSFYGFKNDITSLDADFRGISIESRDMRNIIFNYMKTIVQESIVQSKESNVFEETFKNKLKEISKSAMEKESFTKSDENIRKMFDKISRGDFTLEHFEGSYVLSVKDLSYSINTENSVNSINYNFDIVSKFNKEKIESLIIG